MDEQSQALMAHIGLNLGRLIETRGITVEQLAGASSIAPNAIRQILRGEGEMLVDTLAVLAGALGVAPEVLMDGVLWVPHADGVGGEYRIKDPGGG
jgi:transcriptional regulator with XRE-family HTH domain